MDERFGDWMRDALADIDDDILKRRWVGVEALGAKLEDEEVLDLLLYSTGCGTHDDATLQKVRSTFWEHDNAFRMEGNDLELRRLCGAILIHVLHGKSERRLDAALACICLHFGDRLTNMRGPFCCKKRKRQSNICPQVFVRMMRQNTTPRALFCQLRFWVE